MRTTLDLDDRLLEAARKRAAAQGRSLTAVIEEALAALLALRPAKKAKRFQLELETERGRFVGAVDIADRDALYDAMEGRR